jgi:hypothetical protein
MEDLGTYHQRPDKGDAGRERKALHQVYSESAFIERYELMGWRDFQVKTQVEKKEKKGFNPATDDFYPYFPFKPPKVEAKNYPINPISDCFDPDGTLEVAIEEARVDGWGDDRLCEYIDALREAGCLRAPWGLRFKGSTILGDYWLLSDAEARGRIPLEGRSFALDELKPIVEVKRVFPGAKVVDVRDSKKLSKLSG